MHSPRHTLVSNSLPIGGKRETNGNKNGNETETKGVFLCRNGNEKETKDGNESRQSPHPPGHQESPWTFTLLGWADCCLS
jgi:hypothetical protein